MPTDRQHLQNAVNQLLADLPEVNQLDPTAAERLRQVLSDVQQLLDRPTADGISSGSSTAPASTAAGSPPSDAPRQPPGLVNRLTGAAAHFEESHPQLATTIGNIAGMLGQMGF